MKRGITTVQKCACDAAWVQRGAGKHSAGTWLGPEELAYDLPLRSSVRRARARSENPGGALILVRAGIPDTYFTIPAVHGRKRGWLSFEDNVLVFHPGR